MIKVAIVDDQALVRQGIASLLSLTSGFNLSWQASDGETALTLLAQTPVDVLLLMCACPTWMA